MAEALLVRRDGGGFVIDGKTPMMVTGDTTSTTDVKIANVSGSGIITSISIGNKYNHSYSKLVVDGVTVFDGSAGYNQAGHSMPRVMFHKFLTSFVLTYRTGNSADVCTIACNYLLD